jgi:hypothetical protein
MNRENLGKIEGSGFLVMNFCSHLPELRVIMYVSSLRVLAYNCALVHMTTQYYPTGEKRTSAILPDRGNVLILEFNL